MGCVNTFSTAFQASSPLHREAPSYAGNTTRDLHASDMTIHYASWPAGCQTIQATSSPLDVAGTGVPSNVCPQSHAWCMSHQLVPPNMTDKGLPAVVVYISGKSPSDRSSSSSTSSLSASCPSLSSIPCSIGLINCLTSLLPAAENRASSKNAPTNSRPWISCR